MYFKFTLQKWLGSMSKLKYPNSVFLLVVFIQEGLFWYWLDNACAMKPTSDASIV